MFLGIYEGQSLTIEKVSVPYIHLREKNAECVLIGEMLSSEEDVAFAFKNFIRDQCSEHILFLRGNYQSIIRISNQLWLFADLGNIRPIYYTERNKQWIFSSHLTPIQEQVQSPFNPSWFRRSLSTGGILIETESPYQEIKAIPGGFGFHISHQGDRLFQAWDVDREELLSWSEAQLQLKEELTSSVILRCQGKRVTSDLSGGLDSSTITWIASKQQPVKAITIIGKEENEDGRIAREIVREQKNINQFVLNRDEIPLIYSNMNQIYTDIPIPFLWSANRVKKKLSWARENRSEVHFSGEGGDTVLGADFTYLVDLIHHRKWKTFISHAKSWAQEKRQSPWLWISGSLRLACNLPFQPIQRHPLSPTSNYPEWFRFSPIAEKGRYSRYQGISNTLHGIHYLGYVSHGLKDLADQDQLTLSVPYLDHNVIRLCMRTKSEMKMNPHELKPLLKRAFQDELPSVLLNRNTKGNYTSDVYYGMQQNFSWFQDHFKEMILSEMGLVDIQQFRKCFYRLMIGTPVKLPEFHHTLSLEMWLRQSKSLSLGRMEYETIYS